MTMIKQSNCHAHGGGKNLTGRLEKVKEEIVTYGQYKCQDTLHALSTITCSVVIFMQIYSKEGF